jgi:alpha-aminoadipic semialdehyde synthase
MKKKLCIGLLREPREDERRTPLTPADVKWLVKNGIKVEVESSDTRVFKDKNYERNGARVVDRFQNASLLLGIKQPKVESIYPQAIYMIFSHTMKGEPHNIPVLKALLEKKTTLIDYEKIVDSHGRRLVYFGRLAGICGLVDSLHYLGKKLEWRGRQNPFASLKPAYKYSSLEAINQMLASLEHLLYKKEFECTPFIIGILGHGNASKGLQEMLDLLNVEEVHPKDMLRFFRHQRRKNRKIYKITFLREEKIRSKEGKEFYFEEYLKNPEKFESNLDKYLPYLNMLINTAYWDDRYPRMVTKNMIHKLWRKKPFRLEFIADIPCDINGSIELTYKLTTISNPVFTYNPETRELKDGYKSPGITVLARDNLPSELPKDASVEFSSLIRDYVCQIATHAMPAEVRRAIIVEQGKLTKDFKYLQRFLGKQ